MPHTSGDQPEDWVVSRLYGRGTPDGTAAAKADRIIKNVKTFDTVKKNLTHVLHIYKMGNSIQNFVKSYENTHFTHDIKIHTEFYAGRNFKKIPAKT